MKKRIRRCLLCLLLAACVPLRAESKAAADNREIQVVTDVLNVRELPDLSSDIVKKISYGEKYQIIREENDWIQISLGESKKGWVAGWLISKGVNKENAALNPDSPAAIVSADTLRVRNGPGKQFQVIGSLPRGTEVTILEKNENWVKVTSADISGWAASDYLSAQKKIEDGKDKSPKKSKPTSYEKIAIVTTDSLNIRETPAMDARIVGKLNHGENVPVVLEERDWVKISYRQSQGWVNKNFINMDNSGSSDSKKDEGLRSSKNGTRATVTARSLFVRNSPALNGSVIGTVPKNAEFNILEEKSSWLKIQFERGKTGWAASWFFEKSPGTKPLPAAEKKSARENLKGSKIMILYDGTNLRERADSNSDIVRRAKEGEVFSAAAIKKDWYEIKISNGQTAFVAGWMVSIMGSGPQIEKHGAETYLENKVIIIDPGHGGRDNGTTGAEGSFEKNVTLRTAHLLYDKLKASGARVFLTRSTDTYISLDSRVSISNQHKADAFISIHYDSSDQQGANGFTTYYYHGFQQSLAEDLHHSLVKYLNLNSRGTREGDYHVLRDNNRSAALVELGYLSNPAEEFTILSGNYQEAAATALYYGLAQHFKE